MIGEIINEKYKIESVFSESHMYEIFTAIEVSTGQTVVLKLMKEELAVSTDRVTTFCEEVRNFASLSHPMIAEILDVDLFEERPYVVSPLITGKELNFVMKNEVLSLPDSAKIIQDLAAVLQCAADHKIDNRNINLSNVLLRKDGHVTVLSFTLPRLKLVSATTKRSENAGIQADLYFLGTALFELLAGESPIRKMGGLYELWDMKLEKNLRIRHPELEPALQDKIIDFIGKTLTRDMGKRFDNYEDFLKGLADLSGEVRKNNIRNRYASRQMSMASHVVDVLNGKINDTSSITASTMQPAANEKLAASASLKNSQKLQDENLGYGETSLVEGNLALAVNNLEVSDEAKALTANTKKTPQLRVVKSSKALADSAKNNSEWAEEQNLMKSPVVAIGLVMAIMVLLILFW